MQSGIDVFIDYTMKLLKAEKHRDFGAMLKFSGSYDEKEYQHLKKIFDKHFNKTYWKAGKELQWSDWLINGLFPVILYEMNDCSVKKMMKDERLYYPPTFTDKNSFHSFFGRISRPRTIISKHKNFSGFMDLLLYRMKDKVLRTQPMYYIDTEPAGWILGDIAKNPNQLKTGRTSVTCVVNMMFRWDTIKQCLILNTVVRHNQWSHLFGDVFGSIRILQAVEKELGIKGGYVNLFLLSSSLDENSVARKIVNEYISTN